jgi:hypothetical protein
MKTPPSKLPTPKPRIPQSVERNTKKIEDLEERRLLLQVIEEARAFCKPEHTNASSSHPQRKPSATATAIPARSGTSSDFQRHQQ